MRTKIPAILLICFLSIPNLLATELASNQDRERPISFVSDPSNWLTRETRDSLENHLWKRSNELGAEVFVLLEATPGNSLDTKRQFLKKLGDSWSEKNWAIVSCRPNQIGAPIVVSGGPFQREIDKRFLGQRNLIDAELIPPGLASDT